MRKTRTSPETNPVNNMELTLYTIRTITLCSMYMYYIYRTYLTHTYSTYAVPILLKHLIIHAKFLSESPLSGEDGRSLLIGSSREPDRHRHVDRRVAGRPDGAGLPGEGEGAGEPHHPVPQAGSNADVSTARIG